MTAICARTSSPSRCSCSPAGGLAEEGESIQVVEVSAQPDALTAFLLDDAKEKSPELQHAFLLWLAPHALRDAHLRHYAGVDVLLPTSSRDFTALSASGTALVDAALRTPLGDGSAGALASSWLSLDAWLATIKALLHDRRASVLLATVTACTFVAAFWLGMRSERIAGPTRSQNASTIITARGPQLR